MPVIRKYMFWRRPALHAQHNTTPHSPLSESRGRRRPTPLDGRGREPTHMAVRKQLSYLYRSDHNTNVNYVRRAKSLRLQHPQQQSTTQQSTTRQYISQQSTTQKSTHPGASGNKLHPLYVSRAVFDQLHSQKPLLERSIRSTYAAYKCGYLQKVHSLNPLLTVTPDASALSKL